VAVGETADARTEPDLAVRTNERVRLRLINAALTQAAALRIERHGAHVMAIDGQPSEPFLARDGRVVLGPGNSIDLFIDAALEPGTSTAILLDRGGSDIPLGRLVYGKDSPVRAAPLSAPRPLPANPLPAQLDLARAVRIDVPLATLMRPPVQPQEHPPRFTLARGRTVVLAVINPSEVPFAVHVHGHAMRLLDRLDDAWKPFWLHTIVVDAKQSTRVAFAADNPGRWLIECQAIGGRDFVVADWFEIL
jgi:FtsP/CotA-like multicopper oxidase with cupredoxin domain